VAPLTAPQESVALLVVIPVLDKPVGVGHPEEFVVVKLDCDEYDEQLAFTCQT
jgi:hypothetical protein